MTAGGVTANYTMVKRSHLASILIAALICAAARADGFHSRSLSEVSKAATQGDADAQLEFALRWDYGIGVRRSERQAEKWYRAAAEQGNAQAQNSVGSLLQAQHVNAGIAEQQHILSADELRSCQDKAAEWTPASTPTTK